MSFNITNVGNILPMNRQVACDHTENRNSDVKITQVASKIQSGVEKSQREQFFYQVTLSTGKESPNKFDL